MRNTKLETLGTLLGFTVGIVLIALTKEHYDSWWAVVLGIGPLAMFILAGRYLLSTLPSDRLVATSSLTQGLMGLVVIGLGYSFSWPVWLTAIAVLGAMMVGVVVLRFVGGDAYRAIQMYRYGLRILNHQSLSDAAFKMIVASEKNMVMAGLREALGEARWHTSILGEARIGRVQARAKLREAVNDLVAVGRSTSAKKIFGVGSSLPSGEAVFPWREVLSIPFLFWTVLLAGTSAFVLWWGNRMWAPTLPALWIGVGLTVALIIAGTAVTGYGLLAGDGAPTGLKLARLAILVGGALGCCAMGPVLLSADTPALDIELKTTMEVVLATPVQGLLGLSSLLQSFLPSLPAQVSAAVGLLAITLSVGFVGPLTGSIDLARKKRRTKALGQVIALLEEGELGKACSLLKEEDTTEEVVLVLEVIQLVKQGNYKEALARLEGFPQKTSRVVYLTGYLQLKTGQLNKAVHSLEDSQLKSNPFETGHHLSAALLSYGYELLQKQKYDEAFNLFNRAKKLGVIEVNLPESLQELELKGGIKELNAFRPEKAREKFEQIAISSKDPLTRSLGRAGAIVARYQQGKPPTPNELKEAARTAQDLYVKLGQPIKGEDDVQTAFLDILFKNANIRLDGRVDRRFPRDLHMIAAIAALDAGADPQEVLMSVKSSLELDDKYPEGHLVLGLLYYFINGEKAEALKHLDIARRQGEIMDPFVIELLKELHEEITRIKEARQSYFELLDTYLMDPDVPLSIRQALMKEPWIAQILERFGEQGDPAFASAFERFPSLRDYQKRIDSLERNRISAVINNLSPEIRKEIEQLTKEMREKNRKLEALMQELADVEKNLLIKTGRAVTRV